MSETSTWMPLSIGDYLKNTQHLSAEEHGAYLLLIMHYWIHGKIKNDKKLIKNITKISAKKCENILRLPLVNVTKKTEKNIDIVLKELGLIK